MSRSHAEVLWAAMTTRGSRVRSRRLRDWLARRRDTQRRADARPVAFVAPGQMQYECDVCGEIVSAADYEGPECQMRYDQHENAFGVPAHYIRCEGTLIPQEIEPWEDRDE